MSGVEVYRPRVLTVGVSNIDSLGDLLFQLITRRYLSLSGAEVVMCAPFAADMTALLGCQVQAYGPLLEAEEFDAIWTVGSQFGGPKVGSLDLEGAYWMTASPDAHREFERSSAAERQQILRRAAGDGAVVCAFIPSPLSYPRNAGTITVLNSAGIGYMLDDPSRRDEHAALLRGTTFVSIRDNDSSELLTSLDIEHRLAPDIVHTLSLVRPAERDPDSDVAIFQISKSILADLGPDDVAATLARCASLKGLRVRVLMTGTYGSADSAHHNKDLITRVKQASPTIDIDLIEDRRPFDLVDHIRTARIVIGPSLHLRIPAAAYNVPRVSLSPNNIAVLPAGYDRVTNYARLWDPYMPYDVPLHQLDQAIETALQTADHPKITEHSARITQLAHDNITDLTHQVTTLARTQTPDDKTTRARTRRAHHPSRKPSTMDPVGELSD